MRGRVPWWAEEEDGMDVGIVAEYSCCRRWVSLDRCETRRARVCALAHAVLTVRVVQIDSTARASASASSSSNSERGSAGWCQRSRPHDPSIARPRPMPACLPTWMHARTHARTHRTHDAASACVYSDPATYRARPPPMWLSRAALYSEHAHAQCVVPKHIGPAPAAGHDTWPANLLHPPFPPSPCCRPLHLREPPVVVDGSCCLHALSRDRAPRVMAAPWQASKQAVRYLVISLSR